MRYILTTPDGNHLALTRDKGWLAFVPPASDAPLTYTQAEAKAEVLRINRTHPALTITILEYTK
jgi:hypothetical protein